MGENGVLWVSSAVNFPVVCSCLRVALACTPKLERHHAERALRRSRDLLGQEPTSPSLRAPNDMGKSAPKRASDADQDERPAEAKAGSGQEPPPSGAGGGTDGAPAAPPAPVDSAEELRVLRKRLELGDGEPLFLYCHSAFAPPPDELVADVAAAVKAAG